jgi:putative chitinase
VIPTFEQYMAMFPATKASTPQDHADFVSACERYGIDTPERVAAFCAQVAHESSGRTRFVENLNYTAGRLMQVWPRRFKTRASAVDYQRRGAEAIANCVYQFRNGNGSEASGDGWRFRGRGDFQLTGKDNYRAAALGVGLPLESQPDLAAVPKNGALIAAWYWDSRGLNPLADAGDIMEITRKINGGTIGFPEREAQWRKFKTILGGA